MENVFLILKMVLNKEQDLRPSLQQSMLMPFIKSITVKLNKVFFLTTMTPLLVKMKILFSSRFMRSSPFFIDIFHWFPICLKKIQMKKINEFLLNLDEKRFDD